MNVTNQREIFKTDEQNRTLVQSVSELEMWFSLLTYFNITHSEWLSIGCCLQCLPAVSQLTVILQTPRRLCRHSYFPQCLQSAKIKSMKEWSGRDPIGRKWSLSRDIFWSYISLWRGTTYRCWYR